MYIMSDNGQIIIGCLNCLLTIMHIYTYSNYLIYYLLVSRRLILIKKLKILKMLNLIVVIVVTGVCTCLYK